MLLGPVNLPSQVTNKHPAVFVFLYFYLNLTLSGPINLSSLVTNKHLPHPFKATASCLVVGERNAIISTLRNNQTQDTSKTYKTHVQQQSDITYV